MENSMNEGRKRPHLKPHHWAPGVSGNPGGRPKDPPMLKKVRRLARHEIAELASHLLTQDVEALKRAVKNPKSSAMKVWLCTSAIKGIAKGDFSVLDAILNRTVGKVKDEVELSGKEGGAIRHLVGAMTPEERALELARLRKMKKETNGDDECE